MKNRLNNAVTTLVGPDARITGNLLFGRGCHVAGLVQGDVLASSDKKSELTVAKGGKIEGNAQAANMLIQGTVLGDLRCSGTVSLASAACVEGSIEYREIEIEKGAVVTGSLNGMTEESGKKAPMPSGRSEESGDTKQMQTALG